MKTPQCWCCQRPLCIYRRWHPNQPALARLVSPLPLWVSDISQIFLAFNDIYVQTNLTKRRQECREMKILKHLVQLYTFRIRVYLFCWFRVSLIVLLTVCTTHFIQTGHEQNETHLNSLGQAHQVTILYNSLLLLSCHTPPRSHCKS